MFVFHVLFFAINISNQGKTLCSPCTSWWKQYSARDFGWCVAIQNMAQDIKMPVSTLLL